MEKESIKKSKFLVELSKDHHFTLLFCSKINKGLKWGIASNRLKDYVEFFANQYIVGHFLDEEVLLLNRCTDVLCDQAKAEHAIILEQISNIKTNKQSDSSLYSNLVQSLTNHIRFEERQVFPMLEELLPSATLSSVGEFLAKEHKTMVEENYTDKFWISL